MKRVLAVSALLLLPCPALACTLCGANSFQPNTATFREELAGCKLVLFGTLSNPKINPGTNGGSVDLDIETVVKNDPIVGGKKTVRLDRYVPVDPKNPPKYLIFCDVRNGKLDPYRPLAVKSAAVVDYLRGVGTLNGKDKSTALLFYFRYLDHADGDVAADAYLEFVKATDQEIGQVARRLDPAKLRQLLNDPQTTSSRIGLFGFLLGACGGDKEAELLRGRLDKPTAKDLTALDGLLAGYIQLRPREGWALAQAILQDARRPFTDRSTVMQTLRFYHGWKGDEAKRDLIGCLTPVLQSDIADLAVEDLRKWQWWDLTGQVLGLYGKESTKAPLMSRAIIRYALCCPNKEAVEFVQKVRKNDAGTVKAVEESLDFEKKK